MTSLSFFIFFGILINIVSSRKGDYNWFWDKNFSDGSKHDNDPEREFWRDTHRPLTVRPPRTHKPPSNDDITENYDSTHMETDDPEKTTDNYDDSKTTKYDSVEATSEDNPSDDDDETTTDDNDVTANDSGEYTSPNYDEQTTEDNLSDDNDGTTPDDDGGNDSTTNETTDDYHDPNEGLVHPEYYKKRKDQALHCKANELIRINDSFGCQRCVCNGEGVMLCKWVRCDLKDKNDVHIKEMFNEIMDEAVNTNQVMRKIATGCDPNKKSDIDIHTKQAQRCHCKCVLPGVMTCLKNCFYNEPKKY